MAIGGLGLAALPRWAVGPQLASGALIGLPLQPPGYRWTWSVAQLRANHSPAYVQEFIHMLADRHLFNEFIPGRSKPKKHSSRRKSAAQPRSPVLLSVAV
jgi:hypothetical protein